MYMLIPVEPLQNRGIKGRVLSLILHEERRVVVPCRERTYIVHARESLVAPPQPAHLSDHTG